MKGPLLPESAHLDPSSGSAKATPGLYRKSIKTLIEKKRRTRINASLDQLKELLQSNEGSKTEKASRLEKADILELAVKHLQRLKRAANSDPIRGFTAGYSHCQSTVSSFFRPGEMSDSKLKSQLLLNLEFQDVDTLGFMVYKN
ncbi:enhancer of split mgamma protein-like [Ambystoma mexicanum]|uniref:enhancer of split mgamma protein-like n=1 Tax=Ambystoma mexicanum TaxID=8296 RepID=UPI0037E78CD3